MAKKVAAPFSHPQEKPSPHALLSATLFAILGLLVFSRSARRESTEATDPKRVMQTAKADIQYREVPSGREDVKRYAAVGRTSEEPITVRAWMTAVGSNSSAGARAASDLSAVLSSPPYASFLFETPGASWRSSAGDQFEFALVDAPALRRFAEGDPDRRAFREHFDRCREDALVCAFGNLGGDARLVAPLPREDASDADRSHLAAFARRAPEDQVAEFWRTGARQFLDLAEQKHGDAGADAMTWFSTNGMGVAWLHLRLDSRPKYYSYQPFARPEHVIF